MLIACESRVNKPLGMDALEVLAADLGENLNVEQPEGDTGHRLERKKRVRSQWNTFNHVQLQERTY